MALETDVRAFGCSAHVTSFLDISLYKILGEVLRSPLFRHVPLDEASPDVVHNFCLRHPSSF